MAVAAAAIPADGRVTARTPVSVTEARPWRISQAPHPSPVTPAPRPLGATASPWAAWGTSRESGWGTRGVVPKPAAHWGTIRESGCGTGGVVPYAGTGVSPRKYVGVAGRSGR